MKQFTWKQWVLFILAIPVVNWVGGYVGKTAAQNVIENENLTNKASNAESKIQVIASSQDAQGVTQEQLDINFLNNLESYTRERVKIKTKERLISLGYPNTEVSFASEATYVQNGKTKLAIIRLKSEGTGNQVHITGIDGLELKRVACITPSATSIPISYGTCGDKIKEVFGSMIGS
jgi:hypothetical protein